MTHRPMGRRLQNFLRGFWTEAEPPSRQQERWIRTYLADDRVAFLVKLRPSPERQAVVRAVLACERQRINSLLGEARTSGRLAVADRSMVS